MYKPNGFIKSVPIWKLQTKRWMEGDEGSRREGGGALVLARRVMAQILVTPNLDNNVLPRHQTQTDRGVILFTKQIPKIE